jgi:Photosynthetic reaction centre cytochrome C subunit
LRPSIAFPSFVVTAFIAVMIATPILNAHSMQSSSENAPQAHVYPKPTNLKVLPKDLNGAQVREIMHQWEEALGADCATCHIRDPKNLGPNGRPQFNYADDSKPEKAAARLMYSMVEDINVNYVAKVENSGVPVNCGTCHRGRIGPEPFSTTEKNEGATK